MEVGSVVQKTKLKIDRAGRVKRDAAGRVRLCQIVVVTTAASGSRITAFIRRLPATAAIERSHQASERARFRRSGKNSDSYQRDKLHALALSRYLELDECMMHLNLSGSRHATLTSRSPGRMVSRYPVICCDGSTARTLALPASSCGTNKEKNSPQIPHTKEAKAKGRVATFGKKAIMPHMTHPCSLRDAVVVASFAFRRSIHQLLVRELGGG